MVLLLGANGYIGQAFARELRRRGDNYIPLSLDAFDYTRFGLLFDYIRKMQPSFVINAGSFTGRLDGDSTRTELFRLNIVLPETVARVCVVTNTPWGHVSSGSIYSGAKFFLAGKVRIVPDLNRPESNQLFAAGPQNFLGFTEQDEPNFSFQSSPCDFQGGANALAEQALREYAKGYIWRLRLPFNEFDEPSNWLSQLQRRAALAGGVNSISHLDQCVMACLELWERQAPFGIYNVVNPGPVATSQVLQMIQRILRPTAHLHCLADHEELSQASIPNCVLDGSKLLSAGVKLQRAEAALEDALAKWRPATQPRSEELRAAETWHEGAGRADIPNSLEKATRV